MDDHASYPIKKMAGKKKSSLLSQYYKIVCLPTLAHGTVYQVALTKATAEDVATVL